MNRSLPPDAAHVIDPVDAARADIYALLSSLLWAAPGPAMLARLGALPVDDTPIGRALAALAAAARGADCGRIARAHFELFEGLAGGELQPYASWYLTGFLHERPLADLRADLARLGLERADGVSEPEDHAAFLCETMAVLIREGGDDAGFFARHIAPWMHRFFADLERAAAGAFHGHLGTLGRSFIELEGAAFTLPARGDAA